MASDTCVVNQASVSAGVVDAGLSYVDIVDIKKIQSWFYDYLVDPPRVWILS